MMGQLSHGESKTRRQRERRRERENLYTSERQRESGWLRDDEGVKNR